MVELRSRLSPEERREQLVAAARDEIGRHGFVHFSLEEVALRAGVTRNLLYRYFPSGRTDLYAGVLETAISDLVMAATAFDPGMTTREFRDANVDRIFDHAVRPSTEWSIYVDALGVREPLVTGILDEYHERWAVAVARNNGVAATPTMVSALTAYRIGAVRLLNESARLGHDRRWVRSLLNDLLDVTLATRRFGSPARRVAR